MVDRAPSRNRSPRWLSWLALALLGAAAGCASRTEIIVRQAPEPVPRAAQYGTWQQALVDLDLDAATRLAEISGDADGRALAAAVTEASLGRYQEALALLRHVPQGAIDREGLSALIGQLRLYAAARRDLVPGGPEDGERPAIDRVEFAGPAGAAHSAPLRWAPVLGIPTLAAVAGTVPLTLGLDTGAGVSLLVVDALESIRHTPVTGSDARMQDVAGDAVNGSFALVDLQIGPIVIHDHLCVIVRRADLAAPVRVAFGLAGIDGVLGWNAHRQWRTELDNAAARLTLASSHGGAGRGNLVWFGKPYVRARLPDGGSANMFLDTGSASSRVTERLRRKIDLGDGAISSETALGAGGTRSVTVTTYPRLTFHVGPTQLDLARIRTREARDPAQATQDGTFGNDILRSGLVVIDPPAGLFELKRP